MSVEHSPALTFRTIPMTKRDTSKAVALATEARIARAYVRRKSEVQVAKRVKEIQLRQAEMVARAMALPAIGMTFMYKKENGRSVRMEDPDEIAHALDVIHDNKGIEGEVLYYITTKEPDYRAGEAILNRAIGKVADKLEQKVDVQFSLKSLASLRRDLPELAPMPVEAKVLDAPDE